MNKNELKAQKTKKKLCDTFIELYDEKSIEHITIKNITDKAGYNRGTFYLYYRDVYDIYEKIKNDLLGQMKQNATYLMSQGKNFSLDLAYQFLINFFKKNEKYIMPLVRNDMSFVNSIKENFKPLVYLVFNINSDSDKLEVDYLVEYHLSAIMGTINYWSINKKEVPIEKLVNMIFLVSTKGVITALQDRKNF